MIRQAEHTDRGAILGLAKAFSTSFVVEEKAFQASFEVLLADSSAHLAVAEVEGVVVAYVLAFSHNTFYANGRVVWVEEIMVNLDYRKQGVGKALMQNVEEWATEQDCNLIALATRRAEHFYEAINYQESATYFRKLV